MAGESVKLSIRLASSEASAAELTAEADEYGNIVNKDFETKQEHLGASFVLTAAGETSGRAAEAKFTDGGVMNYSPNVAALTAFSGPSGGTTAGFTQTVTAPSGNGNFQAPAVVTSVSGSGSTPMPASWVSVTGGTGNFTTGPAQNPKSPPDFKLRSVNVTPAANAAPGTYSAVVTSAPAAGSGVGAGQGTVIQLTVTADNAPPTTTLAAVDSNGDPYGGVNFTNANKVTITLSAADAGGSGIQVTRYKIDNQPAQVYSGPFDIAAQGLSVVTYFSVDNTGAQETAKFFNVKIDKTAPAVNCGAADGAWHSSDVSIPCTAADGGGQQKSGLVNAGDASFSLSTNVPAGTEDSNASTGSRQVCDDVNNCTTAGPVAGNKIDRKAPNVSASATKADSSAYVAGAWTNQNVTVGFSCDDGAGSGVASVDGPVTLGSEGANQSASGQCADNVGHSAGATFQPVNIDKTAPGVTAKRNPPANSFGWNNTDVTVSVDTASDALSGVAVTSAPVTVSAEGFNQSATVSATDVAGNTGSATVNNINIDKTAPTVTISSPNAGPYTLNQLVAAVYNCGDGGNPPSGVNTCSGTVASGSNVSTSTVSPHAFTVNASDKAGNTASKTVTYAVVYDWSGYLQPINVDGSSVFKLGSTVPVKFRLVGGSAAVTNAADFKLYVAKVSNNVVGSEVEAVTSTPASTGNLFRYDPSGGIYIYNMGTKGAPWTAGTWQLRVDLGDGVTTRTVLVSLKP